MDSSSSSESDSPGGSIRSQDGAVGDVTPEHHEGPLPPCKPKHKYAVGVCTCPVCERRARREAKKAAAAKRTRRTRKLRKTRKTRALTGTTDEEEEELEEELEELEGEEQEEEEEEEKEKEKRAETETERRARAHGASFDDEFERPSLRDWESLTFSLEGLEEEVSYTWPDIASTDAQTLLKLIVRISSSWNMHANWMFCVNFMEHKMDCASDDYVYEVMWSVPTKQHPVPQATASVYFTAHISRISPPEMPIELSYTFENSCYVHKPDKAIVNFQEQQLINIIHSKIHVFRQIRF